MIEIKYTNVLNCFFLLAYRILPLWGEVRAVSGFSATFIRQLGLKDGLFIGIFGTIYSIMRYPVVEPVTSRTKRRATNPCASLY